MQFKTFASTFTALGIFVSHAVAVPAPEVPATGHFRRSIEPEATALFRKAIEPQATVLFRKAIEPQATALFRKAIELEATAPFRRADGPAITVALRAVETKITLPAGTTTIPGFFRRTDDTGSVDADGNFGRAEDSGIKVPTNFR